MNILHWKQQDTWGRQYQLNAEGQPLGNLSFEDWLSHNAVYTSDAATISFRKSGWFDQGVEIIRNGDKVATASTNLFSKTQLQLLTGETFTLESEVFSNNRAVRDEAGKPVLNFRQSVLNFSNGDIDVVENMPDEHKEVLISTCLYLKLISDNTIAILVMMLLCYVIIFT